MATDHTGKNEHWRTGRMTPHGAGEPELDSPEQEPTEGAGLHGGPPEERERERSDEPGVRKKVR